MPLGHGTERIEQALANRYPRKRIERLDSDRLGRRHELERLLDDVRARKVDVLVGTQILAKGHDFPNLSLVGIVSADQALYGADFRSEEHTSELQSLMRISYAVFCLKKKIKNKQTKL